MDLETGDRAAVACLFEQQALAPHSVALACRQCHLWALPTTAEAEQGTRATLILDVLSISILQFFRKPNRGQAGACALHSLHGSAAVRRLTSRWPSAGEGDGPVLATVLATWANHSSKSNQSFRIVSTQGMNMASPINGQEPTSVIRCGVRPSARCYCTINDLNHMLKP